MKDPIKLANDVNTGKFKSVKKSILPFFTQSLDEDGNPYYIGDPEKRIQVREETLDFDFCNNAVAKIKGTGDTSGLAPLTIINFREKTIQDEKVFHGKMIGNGNHTDSDNDDVTYHKNTIANKNQRRNNDKNRNNTKNKIRRTGVT